LAEPVLSSADEELDMDTPAHDTGSSYTGAAQEARARDSAQASVMRFVQARPGRAALMALGAGAALALLLGGRRRRHKD
jgi:hypothetical protein